MPTLTNQDTQIAAFLERQPYAVNPESPDEPQVIFRGALELDRAQEEALVEAALRWEEALRAELGREQLDVESDAFVPPMQDQCDVEDMRFLQQRALWAAIYKQRMGWRRRFWPGIYSEGQNVHFPLTKRTVQQMISRAANYFFQTLPWFATTPVGVDPTIAQVAGDWAQYKLDQVRVRPVIEQAIEQAMKQGECVVKVEPTERASYYESFEAVAIGPDNEPILTPDGAPILESDTFIVTEQGSVHESSGIAQADWIFENRKLTMRNEEYSGPEVQIVPFRDFLAPLDAPSLAEAECTVHYVDLPAIQIAEEYIERATRHGEFDADEYPCVMNFLHDASGSSKAPSTAMRARTPDAGGVAAEGSAGDRGDPIVHAAIFCLWIDANNDGRREDVYLMVDMDTRRPILYDYVANVFLDRKRPYRCIRINPEPNRWHGNGMCDVFWPLQRNIDLQINRFDMSNSRSGSVTFWNPTETVEGAANPQLKLNHGKTYTKRNAQVRAENIVERVQLQEFKNGDIDRIMQLYMQVFTNIGGVANANDANAAGLETSKLATGIRNLDRSGQEQFAPLLSHLSEGIQDVAETALVIAVRTMDDEEAFQILGPDGLMVMQSIRKADLKRLTWNFRLELTRYRAEQEIAESGAAITVAKDYYFGLNGDVGVQQRLHPLYQQQLKNYGVRHADEIISPPAPEAVQAMRQQGAQASQGVPAETGTTPDLTSVRPSA